MTLQINARHPRIQEHTKKKSRHRFTASDFWALAECGVLDGQRVELILGKIVKMSALSMPHTLSVSSTRRILTRVFGSGYWVTNEITLNLPKDSVFDPDIAVLRGEQHAWEGRSNPTTALLVVEVANTSVSLDRGRKLQVYAAAKIADYWIVNLKTRKLEVYRKPKADKSSRTGWSYGTVTMLTEKESIAPLAKPKSAVKVSDLLPRKS
jgi:Uma2 family endonuclease